MIRCNHRTRKSTGPRENTALTVHQVAWKLLSCINRRKTAAGGFETSETSPMMSHLILKKPHRDPIRRFAQHKAQFRNAGGRSGDYAGQGDRHRSNKPRRDPDLDRQSHWRTDSREVAPRRLPPVALPSSHPAAAASRHVFEIL